MFTGKKTQYIQYVSSSQLYKLNAITIKIWASYFVDIDNLILKFIWKYKKTVIINTILKEKNNIRRLTLTNFKDYHEATETNTG